jgi:hypothetical protein
VDSSPSLGIITEKQVKSPGIHLGSKKLLFNLQQTLGSHVDVVGNVLSAGGMPLVEVLRHPGHFIPHPSELFATGGRKQIERVRRGGVHLTSR